MCVRCERGARAVSKLEECIDKSAVILVFLSRCYFYSRNCLRELDRTLEMDKPMVLVHEWDDKKGGASLDQLRL